MWLDRINHDIGFTDRLEIVAGGSDFISRFEFIEFIFPYIRTDDIFGLGGFGTDQSADQCISHIPRPDNGNFFVV